MLPIIWNIASFVIALSILVAVHEWGHYYVAKLCKVKILKFSIGFGKPLYKRVTSSGMEFIIASIPLGGYVRMLDGRVDQVSTQDLDVCFDLKPVSQRMAIVAAGPIVNFLFAILALMLAGMLGSQTSKTVVGEVLPNSYAQEAGLLVKDEIVKVGERNVKDWQEVSIEMVRYSGDSSMPITVKDANGLVREKTLPIKGWKLDPDSTDLFGALGFAPFSPALTKTLAAVGPDTPAGKAGLAVNDEIMKLDGTPMKNWGQIVQYIEARPNQTIEVELLRDGSTSNISMTLGQKPEQADQGYLGVSPSREAWPAQYIVEVKEGPIDALVSGTQSTWRLMTVTLEMLGKLLSGDLSVKSLSGPISIAQGAGAHASYGLVAFLGFLAIISVNLGIINLLPLPILDGGHLLYFTIEWITGKPVSEAIQEVGLKIGGVILFAVMATAIFNDILRNT
ncbi:MAG: regulator of sigma E protease [Alphaproteobacteria bacterium]|jgi:regulator of sigma E protease